MRLTLAALLACSAPAQEQPPPVKRPVVATADASIDAPAVDQEAVLAAVQKAMTDLDPVAHQCWAAAAVERFDIEGNFEARISVEPTSVEVVVDTTRNKTLVACMVAVLEKYPWAPPLHGQTIQLPFKFTAPDGQSVIDRNLVPIKTQGAIGIQTLLDENNSNNDAASMLEVTIAAHKAVGYRQAQRAELWYFSTPAEVAMAPDRWKPVAAGDMMFVPAKSMRDVRATDEAHAVVVYVPGGREGTARAGALEARDATKGDLGAKLLRASDAKTYGPATIYLDDKVVKGTPLAASVLRLPAGANVAEHVHDKETEMLYVLAGSGTLTVAGVQLPVTPTSVVQIPMNTKHSFKATDALEAVQIYTPAGPEQRFKNK